MCHDPPNLNQSASIHSTLPLPLYEALLIKKRCTLWMPAKHSGTNSGIQPVTLWLCLSLPGYPSFFTSSSFHHSLPSSRMICSSCSFSDLAIHRSSSHEIVLRRFCRQAPESRTVQHAHGISSLCPCLFLKTVCHISGASMKRPS